MARFSSIICGCLFVVASLAAASAQATHPMPINGPVPNLNQQAQPNARGTMQQVPPQQMNQQQQQGLPSANPAQQMGQQPVTRPADSPPPTAPTSPPVVTYRDGMLTVQALNSTLGSVLAAIRSKTGIEFEGLESAPERVAISLGPAPSGEVLSTIFAGSKFDFIAIGRPDSPDVVQRVILSPKKVPGATVASQQPAHQNSGQEGDDDDTPDETVNVGDPQDTPAQPPPAPQAQQQQPDPQQQAQPKSPEQLLQELQEMRKQQEQQQQGVTPNPAQVPRKQPPLN